MPTLDKARIADLIRERRGSNSLRKCAGEAGISHSCIHRFERGDNDNPRTDVLARLADWLGVPMEELMCRN